MLITLKLSNLPKLLYLLPLILSKSFTKTKCKLKTIKIISHTILILWIFYHMCMCMYMLFCL